MAINTDLIVFPTLRRIVAIVVIMGLSNAINPIIGECMESRKQITTGENGLLPITRPLFLSASGAYNTMLADLAKYQETVDWQQIYTVVRPIDPSVRIDIATFWSKLGYKETIS